jgi:hypothetical protein
MYKRKTKTQKNKLKINYSFKCDSKIFNSIQILGNTDNPCRTTKSLWVLYKDYSNKNLSFNINQTKTKFSFDYELQIFERNQNNFYKYKNKSINRQEFIVFLKCE